MSHNFASSALLPFLFVAGWLLLGDQVVEASRTEVTIALVLLAACSAIGLSTLALARFIRWYIKADSWVAVVLTVGAVACVCGLAVHVDHFAVLPLLDARGLMRLATIHFAGVTVLSLQPAKSW